MHRIVLLTLFLVIVNSSYAFDRTEYHQNRIASIDLSDRSVLHNENKQPAEFSSGSSDILISQSIAPATFMQDNSAVIPLSDGNWIVAFQDNRLGSNKIFMQKFDSLGNPVDSNLILVASPIGSDYVDPRLCLDTLGRVYLFFRNQTEGLIYGTRYTSDLIVDVPSFLVNDSTNNAFAGPFDFSVYPDGKIAVVYENYSVSGSTIQLRLYNNSGTSIFGPSTVNTDGASVSHWVPSVAIDNAGNILTAWEDYRNNRADIFARLFNGSGTPLGADFAIVPPPANTFDQYAPELTFSNNDDFVVGWVDMRNGQEIYLQRYSASTGLVGTNLLASSGNSLYINWNVHLTVDTTEAIHLTYAFFGPQIAIAKQKFITGLTPDGSTLTINELTVGSRWRPALAFNDKNEYAAAWTEFLNDNGDIRLALFDDTDNPIGLESTVNDDAIGAVSLNPNAAVSTDWYNLVVFEDQRNDDGDVYLQTVSNAGIKLNANLKINQDNGTNHQSEPFVTASIAHAKSLVVWVDSRDINAVPGQRIFARFGSEFGSFTLDEFLVSDSSAIAIKNRPYAVIAPNGKTLITWTDHRDGSDHVYGQWLTSGGVLDGANFRISNLLTDSSVVDLQSGVDSSGNFYIFWLDELLATPLLKVVRYNPDGSFGFSFTKSFTADGHALKSISAAVKSNGNIVVLYRGLATNKRIYAAEYLSDGTEVFSPFEIIDITGHDGFDQKLSISNNDYISTIWVDTRNSKKEIFFQIFDSALNPIGANSKTTSDNPEIMITPNITAHNGRAWFYWADPTENGMNIYANSYIYLATDITDNLTDNLPDNFQLMQNFPNPFNPTTEISFFISGQTNVKLAVFNMLGQQVKVLTDKEYPAGQHRLIWNATNETGQKVASGLYFYKMITDNHVEMKKMVLLK